MNNTFWRTGWCLALAVAWGPAGAASGPADPDEAVLRRLNDDYARAFVRSDTALYGALLADDFRAILADGRPIDRAEFLRQAAQPSGARDFRLGDVSVRVYGDAAVVTSLADYRRGDGSAVRTRYVAVYIRRLGRWRIVSVQFTRAAGGA